MIRIVKNERTQQWELFLYEMANGRPVAVHSAVQMERRPWVEGEPVAPALVLSQWDMPDLLKALAEMDLKPGDASKEAGRLEAMGDHLEDLRHMLQLPKKPHHENHK